MCTHICETPDKLSTISAMRMVSQSLNDTYHIVMPDCTVVDAMKKMFSDSSVG